MREIKFRAWFDDGKSQRMFSVGDEFGTSHALDCCRYAQQGQPVTLMQYTGLKDANGVEIYEGDVVKMFYQDWLDKTQVIMFMDGSFGYGNGINMFSAFHCLAMDMRRSAYHFSHAFTVIGNIYQNPELMQCGN